MNFSCRDGAFKLHVSVYADLIIIVQLRRDGI